MNVHHSAVRLNTDVYIHAINLTSTPTQTDNWCLVISTSATENDCDGSNETLSILQGSHYRGLTLSRHPTRSSIGSPRCRASRIFTRGTSASNC